MTDPLAAALSEHIWYTTRVQAGQKPYVQCKCMARLADTDEHAAHVARVARNTMAAA